MKRDTFIFYRSFYEAISELPDENQLEIYIAISSYSLNFEEPNLTGISKTIWTLIKPQLDANNKRFINGKQPKKKSKTEAKQKQKVSKTEANNNNNNNNNNNIDWSKLLNKFNSITSKKSRVIPDKAKKQIQARLKEGYSKEDIIRAIENCYKDKYHQETNHKYLTLEFISRPEKLEKFASIDKKELSIEEKKAQLIKLMHNVH